MTFITKCERIYIVWKEIITKCDEALQLLQSKT